MAECAGILPPFTFWWGDRYSDDLYLHNVSKSLSEKNLYPPAPQTMLPRSGFIGHIPPPCPVMKNFQAIHIQHMIVSTFKISVQDKKAAASVPGIGAQYILSGYFPVVVDFFSSFVVMFLLVISHEL